MLFNIAERLEAYHRKDPKTGCWLWTSFIANTGYGQITNENGKPRGAHRLAYETWIGPIPKGQMVLHKCDVRHCINPEHLFLGTYRDNYRDAKAKGRNTRGERHGMAKLNEGNVRAIIARLSNGEPDTHIAKAFGVNTISVWRIRHRKNWAHIPAPDFPARPMGQPSHRKK